MAEQELSPQESGQPTAAERELARPDLSWTAGVRRRRVRVPSVLQMESTECGAACLAMVLAHYGRWLTLEELRAACGVSRDGANARSIVMAGRANAMVVDGYRRELQQLPDEPFPVIAFWRLDHFVVIEGADRRGLMLNDPALGRTRVSWEEADRDFSGVSLHLAPGPDFQPAGTPPGAWSGLQRRLAGFGSALVYLAVACVALALPIALAPMALQGFVDQVLVSGLVEWLPATVATLAFAAVMTLWLTWWQQTVARRLGLALSQRQAIDFVRHALRLPVGFFLQRYVGDVAFRVQLVDQVSQVASMQVIPALVGLVTAAIVGVTLVFYAWQLAAAALLAAVVVVVAVRASSHWRIGAAARAAREAAGYAGALSFGIRSIETVKSTGTEDEMFVQASGRHARAINALTRLELSSIGYGVLPTFTAAVAAAVFVAFGGVLVINNQLSAGGFVAALALLPLFLGPVGTWAAMATTVQQTRASLDRLDDLLDHPVDPTWEPRPAAAPAAGSSAGSSAPSAPAFAATPSTAHDPSAAVQVDGVTFGYSRTAAPLLQDVSLELTPGRRVGLVGTSGCGKSTLARLAVGLLQPWEGQVRLGGVPLPDVDRRVRARQVGYVDQDIVLFAGSVRDNITLFDPGVPDDVVVAAAQGAGIHDEIMARRGGYDAEVTEGGSNFSGGQRQRLEIARAMAAQPRLLVLDEATSSLDPVKELEVIDALTASGAGLLLVAHRLSTVRECDEILVLDQGVVVERGTHDELLELEGIYASMVLL